MHAGHRENKQRVHAVLGRLAEAGPGAVRGGWPSVTAMLLCNGFLGLGPTRRPVATRVMDFYLHHEGLIRWNWVPLNILHLLKQMDVDVLDRRRAPRLAG